MAGMISSLRGGGGGGNLVKGPKICKQRPCGGGSGPGGWEGGARRKSVIRPIRECAAGQGMVFYLSDLNRLYSFAQVCPKQGM